MLKGSVRIHDLHPTANAILSDVLQGLMNSPRIIPPKYFYDEQGSHLFDEITQTEAYYPTRTEVAILNDNKLAIAEHVHDKCQIIEPGAGSCSKIRILMEALRPAAYVPMDISRQHLMHSAEQIAKDYPWLPVHAVCNDFSKQLVLPDEVPKQQRLVFFPGSSIGNFHPQEAVQYIKGIADIVGEDGQLLIGVDLKKDKAILDRAYDDEQGITAKFNLNLLERVNRELSADFDISQWKHLAFYNQDQGRIEMHLQSLCKQIVQIDDHEFYFQENETIHTECSYKYSVEEFQQLALQAGFTLEKVWLDDKKLFSVHLYSIK